MAVFTVRVLAVTLLAACGSARSIETVSPRALPSVNASSTSAPRFADSVPETSYAFPIADRRERLAQAYSAIDEALAKRLKGAKVPGYAFGLVIDGELAHVFTYGVSDKSTSAAVDDLTRFRIGSITKTFTALSVARLRDAGKLSLESPLADLVTEAQAIRGPTTDSGPVRLRDLLLHDSGLMRNGEYDEAYSTPITRAQVVASLSLPLTAPPSEGYIYSNYGYALLGLAIEQRSGMAFHDFVENEITKPLGLDSAAWKTEDVPIAHRARSYNKDTGAEEAPWKLGALDPSGGLFLDLRDMSRWLAFHMEAYPPRNDAEVGPVRRATIRELLALGRTDPPDEKEHVVFHTALGWDSSKTCGERIVWKSGLVEGFMSQMLFMPEHGVGLVSLSNATMSFYGAHGDVLAALTKTGGLVARRAKPSAELLRGAANWLDVFNDFHRDRYEAVYASSFRVGGNPAEFEQWAHGQRARMGACSHEGTDRVEGTRQARFEMRCEHGSVFVTMGLTADGQQIGSLNNVWSYTPSPHQEEVASEALTHLLKGQSALTSSATDAAKRIDKEAGATLRALHDCKRTDTLSTSSPNEVLYRVQCAKNEVRRVRFTFGEKPDHAIVSTSVENEPPSPAICKSW